MRKCAPIICWLIALCPLLGWADAADRAHEDSIEVCLPGYCSTGIPSDLTSHQAGEVNLVAYSAGELPVLHEVRFGKASGPLAPADALYWLHLEEGLPYGQEAMIAQAKCLMTIGVLSSFEWAEYELDGGLVDLEIWYSSNKDESLIPVAYYQALAGVVLGAEYRDLLVGGKDRQLLAGANVTFEEGTDEPSAFVEWTDQTLNDGRHSLTLRAEVVSDWRQRLRDTQYQTNLRQRLAQFSAKYRLGTFDFAGNGGGLYVGAGVYGQEYSVLDPSQTDGSHLPRADLDQEGSSAFVQLGWDLEQKDLAATPGDGFHYSLLVEQHFGDYDFSRFKADLRRYYPAPNLFGCDKPERHSDGRVNNLRTHFPAASIGVQVQTDLADGDVPYSFERRLGGDSYVRGYTVDRYVGTKLLAARAEYRFALDCNHEHELFVFNDNAWVGEDIDDLESLNSLGAGTLLTLPFMGGIRGGGYYGFAADGSESAYGISLGYTF